jgi:predicted permease
MNFRDAVLRLRALLAPRRVERELDEELAFHIEREIRKHLDAGLSPRDARNRALVRFGSRTIAADQCRDARGTTLVDTLARDVAYAFRTFRRAPLAALTIVVTVALGLGLITVVFTAYNAFFLRVDAVRNPGELFGVERPTAPGAEILLPFTRSDYEAMRRETSVFTDSFATVRPLQARIDGRRVNSALVTGNFFQMLGVRPALGRVLTPDDDEGAGRPVIVLSHRGWSKLFAGDPTAIGRSVRVNGRPYEIVGIMPADFRGLAIGPPDYWAPLALVGQFRDDYAGREDESPVDIIGRVKPALSQEAVTGELNAWARRAEPPPSRAERAAASLAGAFGGGGTTTAERPVIRLRPRQGTLLADGNEALIVFSPVFFAFGLILMIGCANVANLLLARGISRQREIGIRLSLGAARKRIVRQLLTESLLLALMAAVCGYAVSWLFQQGALYAATATMPPEVAEPFNLDMPPADWRVFVFLVAGASVSTLIFGLAPALQTTRLELVQTLRGEVMRDVRPDRARHALIALQVGASALLLICSGIFLRSAYAAASVDPGVRTSDTIWIPTVNETRRAALLEAIKADRSVVALAASSQKTGAVADASVPGEATAQPTPSLSRVSVDQIAASPEYFGVLDIDIVSGRGFTPAERSAEAGVVMVTETVARALWPNRDAVGQMVRMEALPSSTPGVASLPSRVFIVIGIVRDVNGPLAPDLFPSWGVYVPTGPENPGTGLTLRVRGDPEQARQALIKSLMTVDPGLGEIDTMRTIAGLQAYILQILFWVTIVLGGLALALTLSGLFSVLSYVVEQRVKDIGVRLALGATARNVAGLVLSQSFRPIGVGLSVGSGLAAVLATVLTSLDESGELGNLVRVFDPRAFIVSVLIIATACLLATAIPALRAARIDPIATLRKE